MCSTAKGRRRTIIYYDGGGAVLLLQRLSAPILLHGKGLLELDLLDWVELWRRKVGGRTRSAQVDAVGCGRCHLGRFVGFWVGIVGWKAPGPLGINVVKSRGMCTCLEDGEGGLGGSKGRHCDGRMDYISQVCSRKNLEQDGFRGGFPRSCIFACELCSTVHT